MGSDPPTPFSRPSTQNDHRLGYNVVEQSKTLACSKEKEAKKSQKNLSQAHCKK